MREEHFHGDAGHLLFQYLSHSHQTFKKTTSSANGCAKEPAQAKNAEAESMLIFCMSRLQLTPTDRESRRDISSSASSGVILERNFHSRENMAKMGHTCCTSIQLLCWLLSLSVPKSGSQPLCRKL